MALFDFAFLKRSIGELGSQLQAVRSGIQDLLREREDVANAPAPIADVKQLYGQLIAQRREEYAALMLEHAQYVSKNWPSFFGPDQAAHAGRVLSLATGNKPAGPHSLDMALAGLLGDRFRPALDALLDTLPLGGGLPLAERAVKLAEIDKRLDKLKREELELAQAAADAGLTLKGDASEMVGTKRSARVSAP